MHVETVSASFSHPLHQMVFTVSIFFLLQPDLVGFGLYLIRTMYPFAFLACDSRIHISTDLKLSKDVMSFNFSFPF